MIQVNCIKGITSFPLKTLTSDQVISLPALLIRSVFSEEKKKSSGKFPASVTGNNVPAAMSISSEVSGLVIYLQGCITMNMPLCKSAILAVSKAAKFA